MNGPLAEARGPIKWLKSTHWTIVCESSSVICDGDGPFLALSHTIGLSAGPLVRANKTCACVRRARMVGNYGISAT